MRESRQKEGECEGEKNLFFRGLKKKNKYTFSADRFITAKNDNDSAYAFKDNCMVFAVKLPRCLDVHMSKAK